MLLLLSILLILTIAAFGLASCGTGNTSGTSTTTAASDLVVINGTQVKTFTVADIQKLPIVSGSTGEISSSGTISGPYEYKGAALTDILKSVGGITSSNAIRISAKDGYSMTFSYNQVVNGNEFPTYDSKTGKEVTPAGTITLFLAYENEGKPLDPTAEGPLRVGIMASGQVTDGHWWIKWVQKIEVISVQQPWTLSLQGAITVDMIQSTFESGAAPGCHGKSWTDANGDVWTGIPLWYLVEYVDDSQTMDTIQDAIAVWNKGFQVHIADSNGDIVMYTSDQIKQNDNLLVAYQLDGKALSNKQWPLALVGSGVDSAHQISMINKIKLIFPGTTTTP
jgi:hypothetical protein